MDPTSSIVALVSAAVATAKVVSQLKSFITDVRGIDETVQGFISEMDSLNAVLESIKNSFPKVQRLQAQSDQVKRLWASVIQTGEDCNLAVGKLHRVLRRYDKSTTNAYSALVKHLKLGGEENEILELRRQIMSFNMAFQTSLTGIILCIVSQDRTAGQDLNGIQTYFVALHNRLDDLAEHLTERKRDQEEQQEPRLGSGSSSIDEYVHLIEDLEECHDSAKIIYNTASTVFDQTSTTGSDWFNPMTSGQRDQILDWAERASASPISGCGESALESAPSAFAISSLPTAQTTTSSTVVSGNGRHRVPEMSEQDRDIRNHLAQKGKYYYQTGSYSQAVSAFLEAHEMGPVGFINILSSEHVMADNTLKLWLVLARIRVLSRSRSIRSDFDLGMHVDSKLITRLTDLTDHNISQRDYLDACILAQAQLYLGDLTQAERICDRVLRGIAELKGRTSMIYQEALILMIQVIYSKGLGETAKAWRSSVSIEALRFLAHPFMTCQNEEDLERDTKLFTDHLLKAIEIGNFNIVLYMLIILPATSAQTHAAVPVVAPRSIPGREPIELRQRGIIENPMEMAMSSDSLAIISLLLELPESCGLSGTQSMVEASPRHGSIADPYSHKIQSALCLAIMYNFPSAVEMIIRNGADANQPSFFGEAREANWSRFLDRIKSEINRQLNPSYMWLRPVEQARRYRFKDVETVLVAHGAKFPTHSKWWYRTGKYFLLGIGGVTVIAIAAAAAGIAAGIAVLGGIAWGIVNRSTSFWADYAPEGMEYSVTLVSTGPPSTENYDHEVLPATSRHYVTLTYQLYVLEDVGGLKHPQFLPTDRRLTFPYYNIKDISLLTHVIKKKF